MKTQIKITDARISLLLKSEPYVTYGRRGYVPVIDVENIHSGLDGFLIIDPISLGEPLNEIQIENSGNLKGITIAIQKENSSRMAPYILERLD